jgi:acyl transferase domain-containing protein/surfactin synthase thioesterase subunit/ubiquinone/menaquinone biosynthesis C-methylase UbiE
VQAIRQGHANLAIAGGVNLMLAPDLHSAFQEAGMLSPDGRCRTFDQNAKGYVRAEGCATVLLKPLNLAMQEGDTIYAIVKGSAVNHGGAVKSLTVPNPNAQAEVIVKAYRDARIDPATVALIETHGTGTVLGDPIEVTGLTKAFATLYADWGLANPHHPHCRLGAVKTNIGHLEAAAGIAGLIKVILAMLAQKIPPNLHHVQRNSQIKLEDTPFALSDELVDWQVSLDRYGEPVPRRAGVSSFGFGGVNAHIVLEEGREGVKVATANMERPELFILSAKTHKRLQAYVVSWLAYLNQTHAPLSLRDLCYTLQVGREPMTARIAVIANNFVDLREKLSTIAKDSELPRDCWKSSTTSQEDVIQEILANEAGLQFLDTLIKNRDLATLARVWVGGVDVDWRRLHATPGRRLWLPTYPFDKTRYWFRESAINRTAKPTRHTVHPFQQVERYALFGLNKTLKHMGAIKTDGQLASPEELGILKKYHSLFAALGEAYQNTDELMTTSEFDSLCLQSASKVAAYYAYFNLLARCLERLPEVLTGRIPPLEILFPEGSTQLVEAVYRDNPDTQRLNYLLADAVAVRVRELLPQRPDKVRVLEIGAGTGATSRVILNQLAELSDRVEYHYTDIGQGFVQQAEQRLGKHYPYVRFYSLDIQDTLPARHEKAFDVVVAANVLHATRNMVTTLGHVARLLGQNGQLLLTELTKPTLFANLTFGLTEDWWAFEDPQHRCTGAPLLNLDQWRTRLAAAGFGTIEERSETWQDDPLGQVMIRSQLAAGGAPKIEAEERDYEVLLDHLRQLFHRVTRVPLAQLSEEANFDQFGIDSLLSLQIIAALRQDLGPLPETLLYQENSLAKLTAYLLKHHERRLRHLWESIQPVERAVGQPAITRPATHAITPPTIHEGIAIIGLAGRYPMAENLDQFWENLVRGRDCVTKVPESRWDYRQYPCHNGRSEAIYPWGAFLDGIDEFDPLLFGISPNEAKLMDPHERLFLQSAWTAMEDAGYCRQQLMANASNAIGVFVGMSYNNYQLWAAEQWAWGRLNAFSSQIVSVANRVSYQLNLNGPSIPVDTACSSSLTAVHLACESLHRGECHTAIAGGVNLSLHPSKYYYLAAHGYLSPTGRCHAFGDKADGMVPGEGVGAVVLKPLNKAVEDGDHIYAIIRGSSCNHGGKVSGYTVPNPHAQATLIKDAFRKARIESSAISYVEAHGTGTALGDPVEIAGLSEAFENYPHGPGTCAIGSVKSNLGHLEAAAGIAQLTKVILQLEHRLLVPSLHAERLNPHIEFHSTPFRVQKTLADWKPPRAGMPLCVGISSFGAGGVNTHLIVEEYSQEKLGRRVEISPPSYALVLSAQSKLQLKAYAMAFLDWVKQDQTCSLTSITYTLQTGRDAMKRRLALVVSNREDIIAGLQAFVDGTACSNLFVGQGLENGDRIPDPSVMSLDQLARRWIDGAEVAWDKLYQGDKPEKTSLPTYPFARESYWITENVTQTQPGFASARPDHLFHEKALQELICELLSEILGVSSELIDPETGFFQLGMESMQALRLKQGLEDRLGLTLPDTLVFEHPNLANLARYLAARNSSATLDKIAHSSTAPAKPNYDAVEPVAIVGMAFRFPGGIDGPESFWALLTSGRTVVSEPPIGRWHPAAYGKPPYTQRGSFLTHPVEAFDARFFHISPKEATAMDPQQRLLLELTWEALENAGQAPDQLEGSRSGVFSGITGSDYERLQDTSSIGDYFATGSMVNMAAGRVAHFFGLQGPVFAVDTACSSSLVGLHLACRSLRSKECDFALVGGASLMLSPDIFTALCEMKALAPDGCCKSFDARADGYGRGEGCAVLALRRLGDAEANGDHILAIVRGSAINHDGASSGLTVPNPLAQQALIKAALLDAQVSSNQISYVEAHGTGTALGDPIEIEALGQIYGEQRSSVLWLGSVKSSIGHLEAAAGLAGLIKTILVLNNQAIPPQANLKTLNPRLSLGAIPAKVPTTTTPWKSEGRPRLAAVSSFGFSGTNAHVILSERPKLSGSERTCQGTGQHLLVLSAKSHDALVELAGRYRAFLRETKESLDNVCYTAATGRASLRYRLALLVDSKADAITKLETECTRLEQMPTTFETPLRPSHIGIVGDGTKHPVAELVALCNGQSRVYDSAAAASKAGCRVVIDAPDNDRQILESAARLFHEGLSLKWQALYSGRSYRKTPLPTYPFQRQRFWKAPALDRGPIGKSHLIDTAVGEPFSPSVIESPLRTHIFRFTLNPDNWPEINDTHGIVHVGVYQEWLTQALVVMGSRLWVAQMTFKEPMLLTGIREIQLLISPPNGADSQTFRFFTRAAEATWTLHAKGRLMPHGILAESVDVAGIQRRCLTRLDGAAFYHQMELRGVTVGPSVRWAEVLWLGSDECLARLRTQGRDVPARAYRLGCHPGVIDTCAQLAHAVLPTDTDVGGVFMVASWEGVEWLEAWDRLPTWCYVRRKSERDDQDHFCVTIRLSADSGQILFQVNAVRLQKIADGFRKASNSNHHTVNNARGQTTDQTLRAYLRERIASVLEMEIDDIKDEHTLRELGVDSLASMQLRASIQQDWGIEAPVSEWLKDPSLAALSVLLTQSLNKGCDRAPAVMSLPDAEANSVNRFFAYHRSQPDPQVRLFCLPYGGRGASLYRGWQDAFSDKIEVYPVQLPGRENRSGEAPVRSLDRLVAQLAEALIPLLDRPFALYGHSFGALIAYRLVRFLHAETGLCANYLFVGAFTAPYLPNSWLQCCLRQLYQLGYSVVPEPTADNLELLKAILLGEEKTLVPMRDSPEFLQTVLPTLLADLSVVDSYRHQDESRVPCPITAFSGLADDRVSVAEMAAWKELTSGRFQLNTLEGDHFFLHEDQSAIKLRRRIESTLLLPGVKGEHRALRQPEAKPCS